MTDLIPTIGIETHIELNTKSKMFCSCANDTFDVEPNTNICPICTGQPGTLPTANIDGVRSAYKAAIAFKCKVPLESRFERKNYFYPDLPKGYQISSPHYPQGVGGFIEFEDKQGQYHKVHLDHIHLEEDAGKLIHDDRANQFTLVDFNRAGVPLLEIVSDAMTEDLTSVEAAVGYVKAVRNLARAIGISDVNMHKGEMRFDVNVSMKEKTSKKFGNRIEVKNLNSFKALEAAIRSEIVRQTEILEGGGDIKQETVGFDYKTLTTKPQREKEGEADYRYFPEPNLPPIKIGPKSPIEIEVLTTELPELPYNKYQRFLDQYQISKNNALLITNQQKVASFFENVCSELESADHDIEAKETLTGKDLLKAYKLASNYIVTELMKSDQKMAEDENLIEINKNLTAENFAEMIKYLLAGKINSSIAQEVLHEMRKTGIDPSRYLDENDLWQKSDAGDLESIANKVIADNPGPVADFEKGKENAVMFLVGQMMKETKGQANPEVAKELLIKLLKSK